MLACYESLGSMPSRYQYAWYERPRRCDLTFVRMGNVVCGIEGGVDASETLVFGRDA